MDTLLTAKPKKDKGYHIREFDPRARRLAKAGASVAGVSIGTWISQAVREKFNRDISKKGGEDES
jgi:predicted HicB family RNase H-like nuclease